MTFFSDGDGDGDGDAESKALLIEKELYGHNLHNARLPISQSFEFSMVAEEEIMREREDEETWAARNVCTQECIDVTRFYLLSRIPKSPLAGNYYYDNIKNQVKLFILFL